MNGNGEGLIPMRVLFASSSGGHLFQLYQLRPWWSQHERKWVTFDKADARSLLEGEDVEFGYHPTTRNIPNLLRNLWLAFKLIRAHRSDLVVSDGAGIGFPFLLAAKLLRAKTIYIEVFDRQDSLTGKLVRPVADVFLVQREAQLESYPAARVLGPILYHPEVNIPGFDTAAASANGNGGIFVTVGTDHHPFDRLIEWCDEFAASNNVECFVQRGPAGQPRSCTGADYLDYSEMVRRIGGARAVITHGGPATVALCLALGQVPIVVPRSSDLDEVVDDHQMAFAKRLEETGHARVATTHEQFSGHIADALGSGKSEIPDLSQFSAEESVELLEEIAKELLAGAKARR